MSAIDRFVGDYAFLSNYHPRPLSYDGKEWPTLEHAYQAQKTSNPEEQELIRTAPKPGIAKGLGHRVSFLRPDWEERKVDIMHELLTRKFTQNPDLGRRLLATDHALLVEGNKWHDNFWGDCICRKCRNIEGQNLLGKLLMQIRQTLDTSTSVTPPPGTPAPR